MTPEIAGRLAACDILMAAQAKDYCMFVRGNCVALVQTAGERFTSVGSTGMMTEKVASRSRAHNSATYARRGESRELAVE